ncbi:MAG TPA: hypothetical protein VH299_09560 [Solirubrobacterales bacterium]|jgi:hypothetical protein|nr:hypothetical protein [Solirubrobacterales bacterium]
MDRFKDVFERKADQLVFVRIPDPAPPVTFVADESYVSLSLVHGFLGRDADWFTRHLPVVHLSSRFDVAGQVATITKVVKHDDPGVWLNYPLTGIVPYRGGTIEMEAGMSVIREGNRVGAAIGTLADLSTLVGPPLSTSLTVARKLTQGIEGFLSEQDEVVLAIHDTFVAPRGGGENALAPGHLAVVGATQKQLKPDELSVAEGCLQRTVDGHTAPLRGFDYMLFRVEAIRERGDWKFPHFEALVRRAIDAHFASDPAAFKTFRNAALAEVLKSPDLISADRFRGVRSIDDELKRIVQMGIGFTAPSEVDLKDIVDRYAPSVEDPIATAPIYLEEVIE